MSKLAKAIPMAFARISFILACAELLTTRMFVPWRVDLVEARVFNTVQQELMVLAC